MAFWQVEEKGLLVEDVASSMYFDHKAKDAGQDVMRVMPYLHSSMEREAVGVAQMQKLWLLEHEDWTMSLSCSDILHLKNWKLRENFDAGRLRHGTWKNTDPSHDQLVALCLELHHMFEDEILWSARDTRRFFLVAFAWFSLTFVPLSWVAGEPLGLARKIQASGQLQGPLRTCLCSVEAELKKMPLLAE